MGGARRWPPLPLLLLASLIPSAAQQEPPPQASLASQMPAAPAGGQWKDVDYKIHSILHDAALEGNVAKVTELLEAGDMNINEQRGSAFNTPLHNAATKDNLDVAKLLVEVGAAPIQETTADGRINFRIGHEVADIDARNEIQATPLMFACGAMQTEMMLYLMESGANVMLETESGGTAMHFAVRSNVTELIAAFLERQSRNGSIPVAICIKIFFGIKNDEFGIRNDEFCISNDEFCI